MPLAIATSTGTIEIGDVGLDVGENPADRIGSLLLKKWRLDELLGVGGTGAVYAATHRNGHRVAIKVLHPRLSSDALTGWRLEQEACLSNKIDHPGVVPIFDDGRTDDGAIFLVMELLDGEALHTRLARKNGRLSPAEALGITHGLLDVLTVAHKRKILHGDIKPENVFITRRGEVKLLDFGVGGMFEASRTASSDAEDGLYGTPGYMAPEQALGQVEEIDARTDLWAVGATLFRMVTGQVVHSASSLIEQLVDAGTKPAAPLKSVLPEVDPALAAVLDRALAFDKAGRFPDAAEMQEAVRRCTQDGAMGPASLAPGATVEPPPPAEGGKRAPAPAGERTMRVFRIRFRRTSRKLLLAAGGAAMMAASVVSIGDPRPPVASLPDLEPPPVAQAAAPAEAAISDQSLIKWAPIAPAAKPADVVNRAGRRSRASKRPRAVSSVAADDDIWGRRH
jgi:eukaryotic-like serine/threonine-protein kinase